MSVILLNLLMNTWTRSVKAGTVAAMPKVYDDDAGILSTDSEDIDAALQITGRFASVAQQKLNVEKSSRVPKKQRRKLRIVSCWTANILML